MPAGDSVGLQEELDRVGDGLALRDQLHRKSFLEEEGEVLGGVWGLQWIHGLSQSVVSMSL